MGFGIIEWLGCWIVGLFKCIIINLFLFEHVLKFELFNYSSGGCIFKLNQENSPFEGGVRGMLRMDCWIIAIMKLIVHNITRSHFIFETNPRIGGAG